MSQSKKLILLTTLLQLCLSVEQQFKKDNPEFGDILVFSKTGQCGIKIANHYAIFVDDEDIPGKKEKGHNIFHMLKYDDGTSGCAFTHWNPKPVTVHNYQDDKVRPIKEDIIAALTEMNENCGEWSWTNTCEHIATSIRYGAAHATCQQKGSLASAICPFINLFSKMKNSINASKSQRAVAEAA